MRATLRLCALLALTASPAAAQEDEALIEGDVDWSLFAGVSFKLTEMVDEFAVIGGARAGLIADRTFAIGLGAYGLVSDLELPTFADPNVEFLYGGLELEYIGNTGALVHWYAHTLVGVGAWFRDGDDDEVFVVEPAVGLEVNVTRFLRLDLGAGYRSVSRVSVAELEKGDLSALFGVLALRLGSF